MARHTNLVQIVFLLSVLVNGYASPAGEKVDGLRRALETASGEKTKAPLPSPFALLVI